MHPSIHKDIGAYVETAFCGAVAATAGGTGDDTAVTGATLDRQDYDSAVLSIAYSATLGATETLALSDIEIQESDDGSAWATAESIADDVAAQATGGAGGSTEVGTKQVKVALRGRKRYVRFNFTPDLSADDTDTAIVAAEAVLAGKRVTP